MLGAAPHPALSGHLLPVKAQGEGEGRTVWDYPLLPATCGEKVVEDRMRGSAEDGGVQ
jgi:hypothetical protein